MSALAWPLLILDISGKPMRYLERVNRPSWPVIALSDVLELNGLSRETKVVAGAQIAGDVVTVLTVDGPVKAIPHWLAVAILRAAVNCGTLHQSGFDIVEQGQRIAMAVQLAEIDPADWSAFFEAVNAHPVPSAEVVR